MIGDVAIDQIFNRRRLASRTLVGRGVLAAVDALAQFLRFRARSLDRPGGVGCRSCTAFAAADPVVEEETSGAVLAALGRRADPDTEAVNTILAAIPNRQRSGRRRGGFLDRFGSEFLAFGLLAGNSALLRAVFVLAVLFLSVV